MNSGKENRVASFLKPQEKSSLSWRGCEDAGKLAQDLPSGLP